jgi:general secretion pathway protein D
VFELKHESANNMLPVLRPLISPNNTIAAYPANNTLVVTDYADNVRRIATIIAGIDGSEKQNVDVVALKNSNSIDLATMLAKLLDPATIGSTDATLKVSVIADPRTNSLMLRTSNSARMQAAKALIAKLDVPTTQPGNMHVVPLRNASAVKLSKTLRGMLGKGGGGNDSDTSNQKKPSGNSDGNDQSNPFGSGGSSGSLSGTSGTPPLPGAGLGGSGGGGLGGDSSGGNNGSMFGSNSDDDSQSSGGGMIQADAATNSLIITAPEPVYRNLRNVIDQLDQRRAQVYIESLIIEVSSDKAGQFGIQWQGGLTSSNGNNAVYAGSNFQSATSNGIINLTAAGLGATTTGAAGSALLGLAGTPTIPNGLNIGLLHRFGSILGLGGLLQALGTNSDVNVLSTPNLITLDNEEAKIIVGQNVPFITGQYANTTVGTSAFNTFQRYDVGITLDVKPQISESGLIQLQIYQEDSTVVNGTGSNTGGPTVNKRALKSTVLCDNGQIIVLGGLIQDSYSNGNSKIPWLGDLPLIGGLFRSENKDRTKTDLMVFLRPVIIRDSNDAQRISIDRYDYMRAQTAGYQTDNRMMLDHQIPQLPEVVPGVPGVSQPAQGGAFDLHDAAPVRPGDAQQAAPGSAAPRRAPVPTVAPQPPRGAQGVVFGGDKN